MSYQYINPLYGVQNFQYIYPNQIQNQGFVQNSYTYNPYQTSFYYNNGVSYPFNPLYSPKSTQNYSYLGEIKSPNNDPVSLFQLQSGQKVAIMPKKGQSTIVKTFLNGGSMNESDELRGISHTIEHCLFKGSSKLNDGDVFKLTGLMGANTNASTDYAQTDYYIQSPYMDFEDFKKTIEIQGDMISNPTFDKAALEAEKGPICSEISMMNDDVTTVAFDRVIRNLFQIKSDSKNMVAGSIATVQGLTRENLVNHHQTFYSPNDLYTVVIGDVDVNSAIDLISKNFTIQQTLKNSSLKYKEQLNPIQTPIREDIKSPKINNTNIMMAFSAFLPNDSKSYVIYSMLQEFLSNFSTSDLKNNLEKMNADFSMTHQKTGLNETDPYALVCVMDVNSKDEQKGIDTFYDSILKLQNEPLSDEDINALKTALLKQLEYDLTDSTDCCNILGTSMMNKSDLFTNYKQIIDSITKEDVQNFARQFMDLNKVSMVVVHPESVSDEEISANYKNSKYSLKHSFKQEQKPKGVVSFCGMPKVSTQNVREYNLQNNTRLIVNDTSSKLCVYNWRADTTPIKPKNPNIPAVLAYMFQKGSEYKSQNELERFKELNGINSVVNVNGRSIEILADCLPENSSKTLEMMNELMFHPCLTENDFNEAKKYVKDKLKASQKDASSNLLDKMYPGYFPNLDEKLKTIDNLKYEDMLEFYNQLLQNASSTFVATMPLKQDSTLSHQVIDSLNKSQIKFKDSTPKFSQMYVPNEKANVIYDTDNLNQAQIYKSYKFPLSANIYDEAKFEIVNMILGGSANGRLFADLREKENLAYSVYSNIQSFENTGILTLGILTTTDHKDQNQTSYENVQKSLDGFTRHTEKMKNEYVTDDELSSAKMKLKQNLIAQCQNPLSETSLLMMNAREPFGIKRIDKYIEAIDNVTKEDVKQAANFIFSQNPTISILASADTINSQMPYLQTQGIVQQAEYNEIPLAA